MNPFGVFTYPALLLGFLIRVIQKTLGIFK